MLSKLKLVTAVVLTLIMGLSAAAAASKKAVIKSRQPQKVSAVTERWHRLVIADLKAATLSAENLDSQLEALMNAEGYSFVQKWKRGIDQSALQTQFSKDLKSHLSIMAVLFEKHAKYKKFHQVSEFEFQNLVRRSDYLLSLPVAKNSLQEALGQKKFATDFKTVLAAYNKERMLFDSKTIQIALK